MPYLHYEKRCDQANIYEIIEQVNDRNIYGQDTGECDYPLLVDEVTSSQNERDDGAASVVFDSEDSGKLAKSPSDPNLAERSSVASLPLDFEEGEEEQTFLRAEKDLIRGYLGPRGPLHVSTVHYAYLCFRDH